jgi:hypothetical protein
MSFEGERVMYGDNEPHPVRMALRNEYNREEMREACLNNYDQGRADERERCRLIIKKWEDRNPDWSIWTIILDEIEEPFNPPMGGPRP